MNYFSRKYSIVILVFFMFFTIPFMVVAQEHNRLQEIRLYNMSNSYRLIVTCSANANYVHEFDQYRNRLRFFIDNTVVDLQQRQLRYEKGLVAGITITEQNETQPVSKIDISFRGEVNFELKESIPGVLIIDLKKNSLNTTGAFQPANSVDLMPVDEIVDISSKRAPKDVVSSKSVSKPKHTPPEELLNRELITLDVKEAPVSDVLRLLSRQSKVNIASSNDVVGNVTVSLRDVTVKEALDIIVQANGLAYSYHGEAVMVKPREKFATNELVTKVYRLNHLDANNLKESVTQMLSDAAKVQVFYFNFNQQTADEKSKRQLGGSSRSSTLIVTDTDEHISQLDILVAALDVAPQQVMIEAKLVEVSPQHEMNLGINWDMDINANIFREFIKPSGGASEYGVEVPLDVPGINYGRLTMDRYGAVLNFLNENTNSKLVSNPRILAMDNEESLISVGTNFPVPQITRGVGGQGDVVTFDYRDVNIELRVTPHVGEDGMVTLNVKPMVEEVIGQVTAAGNSAPITSKRTVETIVNLRNNETMVIGGLIRENNKETIRKVWLLGDIPLIGNLFRNKTIMKSQTDLLIFITPRIVETDG